MANTHKAAVLKQVDAELRAELRAQRKAIAAYLATVKRRRAGAVAKAREQCRRSRERANARAREVRAAASREARAIQEAARRSCKAGVKRARKTGTREQSDLERARKLAILDERVATTKRGAKSTPRSTRRERASESDDEVAGNVESSLEPVWRAVARQFKPKPRLSRTEQFLQWVEENPDEVLALQHPDVGDVVKEAEAELARLDKALKKGRLGPKDWQALGTSPAELEAVGLRPDDPDDVAAFLAGYAQHWTELAADVPF